MATLTLHDLDDNLTAHLNQRAIQHGRSPEEEARDILRQALEAIAAFKDALDRCHEAEERLARFMTEGVWLQ